MHVNLAKPETIQEAADMALGLGGLAVGSEVAVIDDPTFALPGLKGKVRSLNAASGTAQVEMPDGSKVDLMTNQLFVL